MNERIDYLELIARLGIDDAHPGGPLASEAMLAALAASGLRPGARILEVGAGGGRSTVRLAAAGYRVTAVERDSRHVARARARLRASALNADVFVHDAETLPFPEATFDAVWSESVALFVSDRALLPLLQALRTHERLTWTALPHLDAALFRATKGAPRT
ncbi:MAG: methyltransferase domain-containing protein [Hydrogenibacillus schlegelii]|nr:methyltransferase domain-containing protein [Hydrogenibacillus schlegelii]